VSEGPASWKLQGAEPMTDAQRRMLNAVCDCMAKQVVWFGHRMDKDSWRHFIAGVILNQPMVPAIDMGNGPRGFVVLQRSSLELSKSQAAEAITALIQAGDRPDEQGLPATQKRVAWSDKVLYGLGYSTTDIHASP